MLEDLIGSHIISIHCVAHKLQLGVMNAVEKDCYLSKFGETTKRVYKFYQRANRTRDLKESAEMLDSDLLRYESYSTSVQ